VNFRRAAFFAGVLALLFVAVAEAADPVNIQIMALEEQPGSMAITVSAVDENRQPFPGLEVNNFNVTVNGKSLPVKQLQTPDAARLPASVLLIVDVSGSMAGEPMNQARQAVLQFIQALEPADSVAILTFDSKVALLQDFTTDRALLNQAAAKLAPAGETALYDAVIAGAAKISEAPPGRRLVVMLTDGKATVGTEQRQASLDAAAAAGVSIVAVGLGADIDRQYLGELTNMTGGRFLEAPTPASLKQAYVDLASAIRSQYTLIVDVPPDVDRTVPGVLRVHVIVRANNAYAERALGPLPGAVPPPFQLNVTGLAAGQRVSGAVTVQPLPDAGVELARAEYYLDGQLLHTSAPPDLAFEFDPASLALGSHVMRVVAVDAAGRAGEIRVPFLAVAPPKTGGGFQVPVMVVAGVGGVIAVLGGIAGALTLYVRRRQAEEDALPYERVKPWAVRTQGPPGPVEESPERGEDGAVQPAEQNFGRLVVIDEEAGAAGGGSIREFALRAAPLSFGSGPDVDIRVRDLGGQIGSEEARIWEQRGMLVFHKLTTLSAMATEGVTPGWQFLEDGDELRIGPYRLIYRAWTPEFEQEPATGEPAEAVGAPEPQPGPDALETGPQEHGMTLRRSEAWPPRYPDPSLGSPAD